MPDSVLLRCSNSFLPIGRVSLFVRRSVARPTNAVDSGQCTQYSQPEASHDSSHHTAPEIRENPKPAGQLFYVDLRDFPECEVMGVIVFSGRASRFSRNFSIRSNINTQSEKLSLVSEIFFSQPCTSYHCLF